MLSPATTSLKLDSGIKSRVQRLAAVQRRSPHWVIREVIGQYMGREEKREQFRQDALAAREDYQATGQYLSSEEADSWLAKLESGEDTDIPECHG